MEGGIMKTLLLGCLLLVGCACNDLYLGDAGWIHYKDTGGVWHPIKIVQETPTAPECEPPVKDMDKCLDAIGMRQH